MNEELLKRIDMQQTAVVKMSNSIIFNPYVQNALTRVQNPANLYNLYLDQQELKALTSQMHIDNPQLLSMYIFDQQGYNRKENTFSVIPDKQMSEFYNQLAQTMTGEDGMVWFTRQFTHENELNTVILNARWMRSKDFETYGLLLLAFNPNLFGSLLEIKSGPNQYILYSQAGEILTSRFEDENLALIDWLAHEPDQTVIPKNYLAVKSKSKTSQMELVQFISLRELEKQTNVLHRYNLLSAAIAILIAILLISWFSKKQLQPLRQLMEGMKHIRRGDLNIRLDANAGNEFDSIRLSFNSAMDYIDELLREVYQRKISERDAVLQALQAQLNPHFLYNTLGSIYWKLYLQNDEETADLIWCLSELLRYCLEPLEQPTTFGDEIQQVQNYLKIQKIRFENLEVSYELEQDTLSIRMIRFLLQPAIENIFKHGFANKTGLLRINIRSFLQNDDFYIAIADNGHGITPDKLELLETSGTTSGIGLSNVRQRIDLLHGPPYGITISSVIEQGTKILIRLPQKSNWQGEMD